MHRLRLAMAHGGRAEVYETSLRDLVLGSGVRADVVIDHPSVAQEHARLIVRRDRVILVDLGHLGWPTRVAAERIHGPVVLSPGVRSWLGDVALDVGLVADEGRASVGQRIAGFLLEAELVSPEVTVRRFRVSRGLDRGELTIAPPDTGWVARVAASCVAIAPHVPELLAKGIEARAAYFVERLPDGVRLEWLLRAIDHRHLSLPLAAGLALLAQTAEAIASLNRLFGAHGSIDGRMIHLGTDGSLLLLRPGPGPHALDDPSLRPFLSPERRRGGAPSLPADLWSLLPLARRLAGPGGRWPDPVRRLLARAGAASPEKRPRDPAQVAEELRRLAQAESVDPSAGHVARAVRTVATPGRPLVRLAART